MEIIELSGLDVIIDDVIYMPSLEAPADKPHPFVYFVTIKNNSDKAVKICGRKWVITALNGDKTIVEGDGVVGQFPKISTGENFSYNSYHVVNSDCIIDGSFFGETQTGVPVFTRIPSFELNVPKWA